MNRRTTTIFATALVALAAGCGGGGDRLSKDAYQQELDAAIQKVEQAFQGLGDSLQKVGSGSGSLDQVAGEVGNIQSELNSAADDLDGVTPPEDVEAPHDKLVDGMRSLSDDLEEFKGAIEEGDTGAIDRFAADAQELESVKKLEEATNELKDKGYDVGAE
jgi:ABC-type transporter Mla subunit MlaD